VERMGIRPQGTFRANSSEVSANPRSYPLLKELRSIPTCVGTTIRAHPSAGGGPVHPHVRGDYLRTGSAVVRASGPSPRAWGLHPAFQGLAAHGRSIPTCVGTTASVMPRTFRGTVHPHMRGDYVGPPPIPAPKHGPSPHAWGLLHHLLDALWGHRSIPTCVGTTSKPSGSPAASAGPSPHAWGLRLAPAPQLTQKTVHPHMRGDYTWPSWGLLRIFGPSPHAWGLHLTRTAKTTPNPHLCV